LSNHYRNKYRAKAPKDERTKFDKWLDECIAEKRSVLLVMYDDEEIICTPIQTDRYMILVNISDEDDEDQALIWVNKGAILKASTEFQENGEGGRGVGIEVR